MTVPRTAGITKLFKGLPENLQEYLSHFPKLVDDGYPWDVSISYLFARTELAQNMIVYGGVVKLHQVHSTVAKSAIDSLHMTRVRFRELYKTIMGKGIAEDAVKKAKEAEIIRDKILHGKSVTDSDKRKAIVSILGFANLLNEQVFVDAGFRPFGSMQGFKGRATSLNTRTSKWVLMGMGIIATKKPTIPQI